jgi:hypothetical protein
MSVPFWVEGGKHCRPCARRGTDSKALSLPEFFRFDGKLFIGSPYP